MSGFKLRNFVSRDPSYNTQPKRTEKKHANENETKTISHLEYKQIQAHKIKLQHSRKHYTNELANRLD